LPLDDSFKKNPKPAQIFESIEHTDREPRGMPSFQSTVVRYRPDLHHLTQVLSGAARPVAARQLSKAPLVPFYKSPLFVPA